MTELFLGFLIAVAPQKKAEFVHSPSNLKFTIPSEAKISRKKDDWTIILPLGSNGDAATVQIFAVSFMAAPEVWESAQKYFAEQQKLIVLGQNREEIAGVPLLLARMQNLNDFGRSVTISGLIYAATEFKLSYRLNASESSIADAEAKWKEVLLSLRPIDGKMPEAERPGRATEAPATKRKPPKIPENKRVPIGAATAVEKGFDIGIVKLSITVAGKPVQLCVPDGWKASLGETGFVSAVHPLSGLTIIIRTHSTLESPSMTSSLMSLASTTLERFSSVTSRTESRPVLNNAGASVIRIIRSGKSADSLPVQYLAGGEKGDLYWLLEFQSSVPLTTQLTLVYDSLIGGMSLEPGS